MLYHKTCKRAMPKNKMLIAVYELKNANNEIVQVHHLDRQMNNGEMQSGCDASKIIAWAKVKEYKGAK